MVKMARPVDQVLDLVVAAVVEPLQVKQDQELQVALAVQVM